MELGRALQELKACEARFRNVLERSVHGILMVDGTGKIRFANHSAAVIFGCKAVELLGEACCFPAVTDRTVELNVQTRDGKGVAVEMWGVATEWDGQPATLLYLQNITERKEKEQELHKLYRAIMDNPCMVMITDAEGHLEYVNPKFSEVTGYTPAEVIGRDHGFFLSDNLPLEEYMQIREIIDRGEQWRGEFTNRKKGGETYWESASVSPIKAADGTISNLLAVKEDITPRKRMEEALRESEERFRTTFDQAPVGIAHVDLEGRWMRINRKLCEIVGYSDEELRRLTFMDITHPADLDASVREINRLLEGEARTYSLDKRYLRRDGSIVWVNVTVSLVSGTDARSTYLVNIVEDVTLRKRAEEEIEVLNTNLAARALELETANRELEAFNYTVSHDLRRPLTNINGFCQIIRDMCGATLGEQCRGYLGEIYDATLRMNQLIDALLKFSCLMRAELHRGRVDLSGMVQAVAADLQLTEPGRRVTFRLAEGVTVTGDENLLRVVVENLLGNAWKYTGQREEGVIEFGVADIDGKPTCFVRDNGIGFAMGEAEKLFIPFQRLSGADEFTGHGIGLATVERIVRRHGGRIWAEGEPEKGATFWFTLPA